MRFAGGGVGCGVGRGVGNGRVNSGGRVRDGICVGGDVVVVRELFAVELI